MISDSVATIEYGIVDTRFMSARKSTERMIKCLNFCNPPQNVEKIILLLAWRFIDKFKAVFNFDNLKKIQCLILSFTSLTAF